MAFMPMLKPTRWPSVNEFGFRLKGVSRRLFRMATLLSLSYAAGCLLIFLCQKSLIYVPHQGLSDSTANL